MGADNIIDKLKHEWEVLTGDASKDKTFCSEQKYANEAEAQAAFTRGLTKLFAVNSWSQLPGINSTFKLYNQQGQPTQTKPEPHYYIEIILPGVNVENWVEIESILEDANSAQFTVHPCPNPLNESDETQHFFVKEASSTFRIERQGTTLFGYQIGKNEKINNHNYQSGVRAFLNTLIAEGGWAGFQDIQWGKLTDYLAGKVETA
ncbi:hypothetical protein [Adhaeribacter pallidiroseus]|uniref:Uncharacterized protein n=1 Tax=Adhaeribacter pallidiroseus TaxID=2072847 RepID=A0A369QT60_9BACT|nr:hypothetical protein [Adhaeribacter pallidiroseus]RDC66506.1 hypothetical protein AHMF7616_05137 [Adhaeribacter pallidiroseus]